MALVVYLGANLALVASYWATVQERTAGVTSLVPRLSKGGGGKESLVHTVCACVKLCTRLARAMTFYDVLVTFDRVLTSALIDF